MHARITFLAFILFLSSCAVTSDRASRFCESSLFLVDAQFEGGSFDRCSFTSPGTLEITVRPEDRPPINESPWYAFRVSPKKPGDINVALKFVDGYARYWPKISADGHNWQPVAANAVQTSEDGTTFNVKLSTDESPLWVAGQELVTTSFYDEWVRKLAARDDIDVRLLGRSVHGRPIHVARTATRSEGILLLGRQHPPEVTGAFAMRPFVDTVLADTPLARQFRDRYSIIISPLINPDGVALGHWRHNVNGVDLNRDWGPFTQPETQSVARLLSGLDELGLQLRLMLDFHSTKSNLFYTQLPEDNTEPQHFATNWLNQARQRLPEFEFKHDAREKSDQANTKNYFFSRYGIPAITYELGDETDREQIVAAATVFAEEMMKVMLEYEPDQRPMSEE